MNPLQHSSALTQGVVAHLAFKATCVDTHESTTLPAQKVETAHPTTQPKIHPPLIDRDSPLEHRTLSYISSLTIYVASSDSSTHYHCSPTLNISLPLPQSGYLNFHIPDYLSSFDFLHDFLRRNSAFFVSLSHVSFGRHVSYLLGIDRSNQKPQTLGTRVRDSKVREARISLQRSLLFPGELYKVGRHQIASVPGES